MEDRRRVNVVDLFKERKLLKVCAPMVRYSKLEFRTLVRKYGCELCFTPMIMADSFVQSIKARHNEFTTNKEDKPIVVQFAAKTVDDFFRATELVSPYCDGVDLNCGCPQRWAMNDGYGAELLTEPQLIKDMVRQVRNKLPTDFSVSVKIRLLPEIRRSIELCRDLEAAGLSFITVHGRTAMERSEPVHYEEIKNIVQSVNVPVIANGDIKTLSDCFQMKELTDCDGVMSARGILQNPALFSAAEVTPLRCVQDWVDLCINSSVTFQCFHHHLVFMLEKVLTKKQRNVFNNLRTFDRVTHFLENNLSINIPPISSMERIEIEYSDKNDGSYFKNKTADVEDFEEYLGEFCTYLANI